MYCWPVQTSSRKCKMINDMFNQISKFHLAQLLDWKIHFGSLLTMAVKPSLGYIRQFSILVRNISPLVRMRLDCWKTGSIAVPVWPVFSLWWTNLSLQLKLMILWCCDGAPTPSLPAMQIQLNLRDNNWLLSHPADWGTGGHTDTASK